MTRWRLDTDQERPPRAGEVADRAAAVDALAAAAHAALDVAGADGGRMCWVIDDEPAAVLMVPAHTAADGDDARAEVADYIGRTAAALAHDIDQESRP